MATKKQTKKDLLIKFIENNDLTFQEGERNTDSVTLSGYALHIGVENVKEIETAIDEALPRAIEEDYEDELHRVFDFAKRNNYQRFWETEQARSRYTF